MAFKDIWRPRVDGDDNADSSAVNEIAEAVIDNENANKKNATAILGKQDKLSKEQLENIDKVPNKQEALTEEQLQNIQDVPNKADADYVNKTFTNILKGSAIGQSVNLTDVSPIEHNLDVKVKSKNKVPYPYYNAVESLNGITLAINENGSITVNGTATAKTTIELASEKKLPVKLEIGKTYTIAGCPKGGNFTTAYALLLQTDKGFQSTAEIGEGRTIVAQYENYSFYLRISQGATVENLTFYPQIEEGSVATGYTPYMADVSTATVKKYGKNLFDPKEAVNRTTQGITSAVQEDGGIAFSGVAAATYRYFTPNFFKNQILLSPGTYTLSGHGKLTIQVKYLDGTSENFVRTFTLKKYGFLRDALLDGLTVGDEYNMTIYPSLVVGSVAEYEPYKEPTTYNVNADGTVEGVTSIYPTTTLLTDTGAVVDVTYNRDINKAFAELEEKLTQAIVSLGNNI